MAAPNRFAVLAEAALAVQRGLDMETTLTALVEAACTVTGARYAALGVLGPDRRVARFVTSGLTAAEVEEIGAPPVGRGILGVPIAEGRALRLDDLAADPRSVGFPPGHPPMRSFLGVPVSVRGEVFGNLYVTEAPEGSFSDEDEQVMLVLALKAGFAIDNARLYAEAQAQTADAVRAARARAGVTAVAASILRERDVTVVMAALAREAQALVQARAVAVGVPDDVSQTVRFPVAVGEGADAILGRELPLADSLSGTVLQAGETLRVDDAASYASAHGSTSDLGASALLAVPMLVGDDPVAVISAIGRTDDAPFSAEDQDVLESLALLGAVAIHTARAFGRERARSEALARIRQVEAASAAQRLGARRVIETQETERRRLAQELHDRTAGALAGVQLSLRRLERDVDAGPLREALGAARADVAAAIDELRDLIVDLRPRVLDDFGLAPALERLGDSLARRSGLIVDVAADPTVNTIAGDVASAAYRIVQEALTNAARHSRAAHVRVSATVEGDTLFVVIEDDGVGFDRARDGYGLEGMRERAVLSGGTLVIATPTGGGTRVTFEAPL